MATPRVDISGPHVYMSPDEIQQRYDALVNLHRQHLQSLGVRMPSEGTHKALHLIYLHKYLGQLVHKDTISAFVRSVNPAAGTDQQVRHLAADGWYVLNRGNAISEDERVPNGYHMLRTVTTVKPDFLHRRLRRLGRVAATTFEELKAVYDFRCATCGDREGGRPRLNPDSVVELEQGHMHPGRPLALDNVIPQCQYCNRTYRDNFIFDRDGRVMAIYNPDFVLRSEPSVQAEMLRLLTRPPDAG